MSQNQESDGLTAPACAPFREDIERLLFEAPDVAAAPDSPGFAVQLGSDALAAHLGECPACAELLEIHAALIAWEDDLAPPTELDEARVRREVRARLERDAKPEHAPSAAAPRALRLALAATLLVAIGVAFVAGRWSAGSGREARLSDRSGTPFAPFEPDALAASDLAGSLLRPIAASLRTPAPSLDLGGAPYSFDNVQLRAAGEDRVRLSFDYSVHLEVERERSDPLVTEVLVHAMLDSASLGTQLKAIDAASEPALSPRLRAALVRTMLSDESAPARQAALERLLPDAQLPDVESALLQVLEREPSVHMRLLAIDALAAGGVPTQRLEQALALGPAEPGQALRLRVGNPDRGL